MQVIDTPIEGLKIIEPELFGDPRGYFFESYNYSKYIQAGITAEFIQDNESLSQYGVLRGLHYQAGEFAQAKLVRVLAGAVWDVTVDIRENSPTFGKYFALELSGENKRQLFIPRGFAHGFAVLSSSAVFAYKCDNIYNPMAERGIRFDDPALNINWQISPQEWILSEKDTRLPGWAAVEPWSEK